MNNYYVSKKMNTYGYHVVHNQNCPNIPERRESLYVGYFTHSAPAVQKAKDYFDLTEACEVCSRRIFSNN